jgi:hypothetical protein
MKADERKEEYPMCRFKVPQPSSISGLSFDNENMYNVELFVDNFLTEMLHVR